MAFKKLGGFCHFFYCFQWGYWLW